MSRWFVYFLFYSFFGYGLEKLFAKAVRSEYQVRKCFLFLPLCPVYGLAMAALLALVPEGAGFFTLAAVGALVCTGVEYLVHLFYERALGVRFWDYRDLPWHIRGRVCPQFSLAWGVLSAAAVRWVQPGVEVLAAWAAPEALYLLWLVLAADGVCTCALLLRRRDPELLSIGALLSQSRASSQSSTS